MKNKTVFNIFLTGSLVCGLVSTAVAKDILDVLGKTSPVGRTFMRSSVDQTYVYPVSYTHLTLPTKRIV